MTTRIYERHICSFKDTGEVCKRWLYFKNFTSYSSEFELIQNKLNYMGFVATLQGKYYIEDIVDDTAERIGDRMTLTDMTLEEYENAKQAAEQDYMSVANLETEYQAYLDGLNQMRNDPNVVWSLDWTLVSTTP
jgi:hypothetical protein